MQKLIQTHVGSRDRVKCVAPVLHDEGQSLRRRRPKEVRLLTDCARLSQLHAAEMRVRC